MDPLSLTASLIAIGTAATTALQISSSLYGLARAYKSAAEEIENFALDLRSFASVVQLGQDSLERHRKKAPFSEVIKYIESLDVLNQLAAQSKRTTKGIEGVWQQTQSLQKDNLLTKIKWMAKKGEVRGLKPDMESLKTSLHLVMAAVTMEALQQSHLGDLQEEINALKQQIQMQLETIKLLQESQERQRVEIGGTPGSGPVSFLNPNAQKALIGLGESMVKNGTVPPVDYSGRASSHSSLQTVQSNITPPDPPKPIDPALKDANIISSDSIKPTMYGNGMASKGFVTYSHQRAGYNRALPFNIVSASLVSYLDCTVSQSEAPNIWVDFGGGRTEKCIGGTKLEWSRERKKSTFDINIPNWHTSVEVYCLVFRGVVPDLIFGKPRESEFEGEWIA